MSLIHNERAKLVANALDRTSTACVAVGIIGPTVAFLYGPSGTLVPNAGLYVAVGALFWLTAAGALHYLAHIALGKLK